MNNRFFFGLMTISFSLAAGTPEKVQKVILQEAIKDRLEKFADSSVEVDITNLKTDSRIFIAQTPHGDFFYFKAKGATRLSLTDNSSACWFYYEIPQGRELFLTKGKLFEEYSFGNAHSSER